jgi:chemotaxis methyl-accepting protein methylase
LRAVQIAPQYVSRVSPLDLNLVLQQLVLDRDEKFDLIIATNILVYYDTFEQSLALANVASMLKPSGFLLSNNGLAELPSIPMHSVGYQTVVYSDHSGDGDHIVWYRRN